jgi:hypothetical protein
MADRDDLMPAPPSHPEEMTADVEIRVGSVATVHLRARVTPAGLVCAAILVSSVLLSVGWMMGQRPAGRGYR